MKKISMLLTALFCAVTLAGCSSNYVMHTNDGRTLISDGKPQVDDETGMISYKDANGNQQQINRNEVKEMVESN